MMMESSETASTGRELVQVSPPETAEDVIGVVVKTDAAKRQARRSSRLVEYTQVYKGDMVIDWDDDSSSSKEENKDMTLMVVETSSEAALNASSSSVEEDVSTITDTAAESSLFTYATSSKQTHTVSLEDNAPKHADVAAAAAAKFLETTRESVLLLASNNNEKDHSSYADALYDDHGVINSIPSSTTTASTTSTRNTPKITSEQHSDAIAKDHRLSTETFSTQPESNESSLVAVSLQEEIQEGQQEGQQEEETYPTTATPTSTTDAYIYRSTDVSKLADNDRDPNYSIYPIVVIHNDDDQVSVCSSACSISTHSTMSTHMNAQPSYHDVERSLIKEEHSDKTQPSQIKAITSFTCFCNEAYWKALLIGCFFGLTLGAIVIFSTLIARNRD